MITYEICNFGTRFLGHYYYILSLSDPYLGEWIKNFFKINIAFSQYDLYGHAPARKPLPQGS